MKIYQLTVDSFRIILDLLSNDFPVCDEDISVSVNYGMIQTHV